ncbi:hypothetical protein EYF80_043741 [Liparis tanakae]|uniref:Uncharacterized protein n=1 Tax=Liparis tanakae TaxID=230148 RepID=A0A4Z2G0K3_9TELE|nr:hypothetical protein EYF80_043741 [Liparis tanakae]
MDFLPLRKKVSGVQMLLASRLFNGSISIGPLKHRRSSFQLWRKKTSMLIKHSGVEIRRKSGCVRGIDRLHAGSPADEWPRTG